MSEVYFSPMAFSRYEASETLPEKFSRMLAACGLGKAVQGKKVAIKMHVGRRRFLFHHPPIFVRKLVQFVQDNGGECFITDHYVARRRPHERGYSEAGLGCPVLDDCAYLENIFTQLKQTIKSCDMWMLPA